MLQSDKKLLLGGLHACVHDANALRSKNHRFNIHRVLFLMMASIAIGTGLLLLVMIVAPWAAVCRAYSSSSASGSASGYAASAEPECKAPPYSNPNNIRVNLTDEQWQELLLEGRCYLACATAQQYQVDLY